MKTKCLGFAFVTTATILAAACGGDDAGTSVTVGGPAGAAGTGGSGPSTGGTSTGGASTGGTSTGGTDGTGATATGGTGTAGEGGFPTAGVGGINEAGAAGTIMAGTGGEAAGGIAGVGTAGEAGSAVGGSAGAGAVEIGGAAGAAGAAGSAGAGGACTDLYYLDQDDDGWGGPTTICGLGGQAGAGGQSWVSDAGDCDDGNADVFPGQLQYFDVPYDPSDGSDPSFDYDCSDAEDTQGNPRLAAAQCNTSPSGLSCDGHGYLPADPPRTGDGVDPYCGSEDYRFCRMMMGECTAVPGTEPAIACK